MGERYVRVFCLLFMCACCRAQDKKADQSPTTAQYLDSLLIDRDLSNYSLRIIAIRKSQDFRFRTGSNTIEYTPNNTFGVGLGFASRKLLVDMVINIRPRDKEPTKRLDIRANYKLDAHFFDFFFQYYRGFNISDTEGTVTPEFRTDVRSIASGLNYLYLLNGEDFKAGTFRTLIDNKSGSAFNYGLGGFALVLNQKADDNLVDIGPGNNAPFGDVNRISGTGLGVLFGIGGVFAMSEHFYSSLSGGIGLGFLRNKVGGNFQEQLGAPFLYTLNAMAVLGYIRDRYYLNLSLEFRYFNTEMIQSVREIIQVSQVKIAFGYRFFR